MFNVNINEIQHFELNSWFNTQQTKCIQLQFFSVFALITFYKFLLICSKNFDFHSFVDFYSSIISFSSAGKTHKMEIIHGILSCYIDANTLWAEKNERKQKEEKMFPSQITQSKFALEFYQFHWSNCQTSKQFLQMGL